MSQHWYVLLASARKLLLLDGSLASAKEIQIDPKDASSEFETISDFALVLKPIDFKASSMTSTNTQLAVIVNGSQLKVFDLELEDGKAAKSGEVSLEKQEDVLRQEYLIGFVKPSFICLVHLWENPIEEDEDEQSEQKVAGKNYLYSMTKTGAIKKLSENTMVIDGEEDEHFFSIDQIRVHLLNGVEGGKPFLSIVVASPATKSYESISLPTDKKALIKQVDLEDGATIE